MTVNDSLTEPDLLERGLTAFAEILEGLQISPYEVGTSQPANLPSQPKDTRADRLVILTAAQGMGSSGPILVEAKRHVTPAGIKNQLQPQVEFMRRLTPDAAVLIITTWLSPRSRQVLDDMGYGYLDLTGNVSFHLHRPLIRIKTEGARNDPWPASGPRPRQLKGLKAGRLVRALVDVTPPYTATQLAEATRLSLPYISRLLDGLDDQGLLTRRGRQVSDIDWVGLLRARADVHPLLKASTVAGYIAQQGFDAALTRLRTLGNSPGTPSWRFAVTGPLAAAVVAPTTIGGQLVLYVDPDHGGLDQRTRMDALARQLRLLPAASGADALLVSADDPVVFTSSRLEDGLPHVALSQLVLDSLSGPGRMPAEGEEVLRHMTQDPSQWRKSTLQQWHLSADA